MPAFLLIGAIGLAGIGYAWMVSRLGAHDDQLRGSLFTYKQKYGLLGATVGFGIGLAVIAYWMRGWWRGRADKPDIQAWQSGAALVGAALYWYVFRGGWGGAQLGFAACGGGLVFAAAGEIVCSLRWRATAPEAPPVHVR